MKLFNSYVCLHDDESNTMVSSLPIKVGVDDNGVFISVYDMMVICGYKKTRDDALVFLKENGCVCAEDSLLPSTQALQALFIANGEHELKCDAQTMMKFAEYICHSLIPNAVSAYAAESERDETDGGGDESRGDTSNG